MKRPAFQFYPADWRNNAKLRRCSPAAKGAWIETMCFLHDSDEYGVARFPLKEIAEAVGVRLALLKELADKGVLKGADKDASPYKYAPRHGNRSGPEVVLVEANGGALWYCSRFVRDEWVRSRRGADTRFSVNNQPGGKDNGKDGETRSPKPTIGERQGYGSTSPSSSTTPAVNGRENGDSAARTPSQGVEGKSTSTPRAAAHSVAKAMQVIEENRAAAQAMAPMPDAVRAMIPKRPKGEDPQPDEVAA